MVKLISFSLFFFLRKKMDSNSPIKIIYDFVFIHNDKKGSLFELKFNDAFDKKDRKKDRKKDKYQWYLIYDGMRHDLTFVESPNEDERTLFSPRYGLIYLHNVLCYELATMEIKIDDDSSSNKNKHLSIKLESKHVVNAEIKETKPEEKKIVDSEIKEKKKDKKSWLPNWFN